MEILNNSMMNRILFLLIIPAFLYLFSLHIMPLLDPDETRYSEVADTMVDTGDYVTPRLNHVIYLEKPPLVSWVTATMFKIFGENQFSSRLFSGLCTWGCIILAFAVGSFLYDEKTGLYSAGVLSTFLYIYILGHINILDIPLTFFVCLATWSGYRYLNGNGRTKGWLYLLYVASSLAFLTKGLIGIVFPFIIIALWLLISRRLQDVFGLFSPVGIIILVAIVSPWLILVQKANKDFLWFFFIHEHFLRYTTHIHERYHSLLFYLPVAIAGAFPWTAFFIQVIIKNGYRTNLNKNDKYFIITWIAFIFVFFSLSSSKLIPYIAPIFLPIAVIFGHIFRQYDEQPWQSTGKSKNRILHYLPVIIQSLLFIGTLLIPIFIKNNKEFGGDLVIVHSRGWLWLVILPIISQALLIFMPEIVKRRLGAGWFMTIYLITVFFLVTLIYPASAFLTPYKSTFPLALAVRSNLPVNEELYQYKNFLYGIEWYTDIRTPVVEDFGEMDFGARLLPPGERSRYFLSEREFFRLCREKGRPVYCVTTKKENLDRLKAAFPRLELIWSNGVYYFVRLIH